MGNKLFHQDRQSVQNAIKYINISIHTQHALIKKGGVYRIAFIDSNFIKKKGGYTTIKVIVISCLGKIQALLSFWEILRDGLPLIYFDFINNKTNIYDKDQYDNLITHKFNECCTQNIDMNFNNFNNNLKLSVYDKITIEQLTDNPTD